MAKICILTSTINYGGATKILIDVANYLSQFHDVMVLYYGKDETTFYQISDRIELCRAPVTKCNVRKVRLLTQMRLIRKSVTKIKPDAVLAFGNTEKLMALGATLGKKTKLIISERQDPYNYQPGKKRTMWLRYLLADGCVFQTEGAAKYFPRSVQEKSVVIPNFIKQEKREFVPIEQKEKIISYSARFELKQKRQDVMVEAFSLLHRDHPDWKLVFYGDGEDQPKIEAMVEKRGLQDSVIFAGKVSGAIDKIYQSAIFALSSDYEGIPNVLLEAMALGVPSVSTDCSPGGARFLIQDGENGMLVPVNDPAALAQALKTLIEDPALANEIGRKGTEVLERFAPSGILPQWNTYVSNVLGESETYENR